MDPGISRTIEITTEPAEPGSAETEGAECRTEVAVEAGVQVGETRETVISADNDCDDEEEGLYTALEEGIDVNGEEDDAQAVEVLGVDADVTFTEKGMGASTKIHNWMTAAKADILDVRCKTVTGQLHKARLGSGGRGRCIRRRGRWFTPTEFEALSGRAGGKEWKRSIRFCGKSLQAVIDAGLLMPHAAVCACAVCSDDPNSSAPVRLFTPYRKRQFRSQSGRNPRQEAGSLSFQPPVSKTGLEVIGDPARPPSGTDEPDLVEEVSALPEQQMWDRLEQMSRSLLRQALSLKQAVRACRERSAAAADTGVTEDDSAESPSGAERRTSPPQPSALQPSNTDARCVNCNRRSTLECGSCHGAAYCSRFCLERDWAGHRGGCRPAVPAPGRPVRATNVMFILTDGSDRVITVSQTQ